MRSNYHIKFECFTHAHIYKISCVLQCRNKFWNHSFDEFLKWTLHSALVAGLHTKSVISTCRDVGSDQKKISSITDIRYSWMGELGLVILEKQLPLIQGKKVSSTLLNKWISAYFKSPHVRYTRSLQLSNMVFPICRTSGSGVCHLRKDNQSSFGPRWQQTRNPPNHIWRETRSWAVGFSDQYCCLWALLGSCNQSSVPRHRSKPLFHVTGATSDGDRSEQNSGEWECPRQEWGAEAGSGKDFSVPCGLWEGCRCCCGGCHGDVPQKIKLLFRVAWDALSFFFLYWLYSVSFHFLTFSGVVFSVSSYSLQWKTHLVFNVCFCSWAYTGSSISLLCHSHLWNET